jgi:hypothetical protein
MFDWLLGKKQYHYYIAFFVFSDRNQGAGNLHLITGFPINNWESFSKASEYVSEKYPHAVVVGWPRLMWVDRVR